MNSLYVGAAKVSINPSPEMYPIPNKITDFGLEPMSQEIAYDEMNCRAIAIKSQNVQMLFLAFELASAPDFPNYLETIAESTGVDPSMIFMTGTHNHSAPRYRKPVVDNKPLADWVERYEKIVYRAGIEACQKAIGAWRPARCGYGESKSYINVNRNYLSFGNYWVEAPNPEGFCDSTLSLMKFVDLEGKLIATFINHPTHATNIYMLKDVDHKTKTSGNFTGITSRFVEDHFGNGAVAIWTSGAAANLNPIMSHGLQYEYPDGYTTHVQYPDGTGYMQMEYIGRRHGADCCRGLNAITEYSDSISIVHKMARIELPALECLEQWPPNDFSEIRNGGYGPRDYQKIPYGELPAPGRVPKMAPGKPKNLLLHLLKMNNTALLFVNAELSAELGARMKAESPLKQTIVVTHHHGPKCQYIFDHTYEGMRLPMAYGGVAPGTADDIILEGERRLFEEILMDE